jgi:hypothetical protein
MTGYQLPQHPLAVVTWCVPPPKDSGFERYMVRLCRWSSVSRPETLGVFKFGAERRYYGLQHCILTHMDKPSYLVRSVTLEIVDTGHSHYNCNKNIPILQTVVQQFSSVNVRWPRLRNVISRVCIVTICFRSTCHGRRLRRRGQLWRRRPIRCWRRFLVIYGSSFSILKQIGHSISRLG